MLQLNGVSPVWRHALEQLNLLSRHTHAELAVECSNGGALSQHNGLCICSMLIQHTYACMPGGCFLLQTLRAVADGADVRGFYWWTLVDNFEWNAGGDGRTLQHIHCTAHRFPGQATYLADATTCLLACVVCLQTDIRHTVPACSSTQSPHGWCVTSAISTAMRWMHSVATLPRGGNYAMQCLECGPQDELLEAVCQHPPLKPRYTSVNI